MAEENVRLVEQDSSALGIVLTVSERFGKAVAALSATSYVIGYAVTAARLAQAAVATTTLIDAQYLAAGLLPGSFAWLTVLVLISGYRYDPRREGRRLKSSWCFAVVSLLALFVMAMIVEVLNGIARERWSDFAQSLLSICDKVIK